MGKPGGLAKFQTRWVLGGLAALSLAACLAPRPPASLGRPAAGGPQGPSAPEAGGLPQAPGKGAAPEALPGDDRLPPEAPQPGVSGAPSALPPVVLTSGGGGSGPEGGVASSLSGFLSAPRPLISDAGGSILSNNGGNVLASQGGGIISNHGGGILSNNGGGILSNNGGSLVVPTRTRYRLAAAYAEEGALRDALLVLTDPNGAFYQDAKGRTLTATSDAQGRFNFPSLSEFPVGRSVMVQAFLNDKLRLFGFVVPQAGDNAFSVNLATTGAGEYLRGEALATGRDMASYDQALFQRLSGDMLSAMQRGEIEVVKAVQDAAGSTVLVNAWDLREDRAQALRNQVAIALSAVPDVAHAALKALSDGWKSLLGQRPVAVTTLAGTGKVPELKPGASGATGYATGDPRGPGGISLLAKDLPLGNPTSVAVSRAGDVFVAAYTDQRTSGHIRWIHPDGRVSSVYLGEQFFGFARPLRLAIEREPVAPAEIGPGRPPGSLLVVDDEDHTLQRVPILEAPLEELVDPASYPNTFREHPHWAQLAPVVGEYWGAIANTGGWIPDYVVGENVAAFYGGYLQEHPAFGLDRPDKELIQAPMIDGAATASAWRLEDEGPRVWRLASGDEASSAPDQARFAHLNAPASVAVDELGSIFIADRANHRVRMIPSAAAVAAAPGGQLYGYRQPLDQNGDGVVEAFGAPVAMQAGCLYTIAGHPRWSPGETPSSVRGHWVGEYGGDGGPAQEARFDQPYDLAVHQGKVYVVDFDNQRVRCITPDGTVQTVAGAPSGGPIVEAADRYYAAGTAGDGGLATAAQLAFPRAVVVDAKGRLFIADTNSGRIRMVDEAGVIRTVAGRLQPLDGSQPADHQGDGEALRWADLSQVQDLALDPQGNLLLVELRQSRVRKVWRQWEP